MRAHTPVPWRYQREDEVQPGRLRTIEFHIYTASGKYGHPATCDNKADAEFIVRACNAHEDLLEALKESLGFVAAWTGGYQAEHGLKDWHPRHAETIAKVQAAIAKAESR